LIVLLIIATYVLALAGAWYRKISGAKAYGDSLNIVTVVFSCISTIVLFSALSKISKVIKRHPTLRQSS